MLYLQNSERPAFFANEIAHEIRLNDSHKKNWAMMAVRESTAIRSCGKIIISRIGMKKEAIQICFSQGRLWAVWEANPIWRYRSCKIFSAQICAATSSVAKVIVLQKRNDRHKLLVRILTKSWLLQIFYSSFLIWKEGAHEGIGTTALWSDHRDQTSWLLVSVCLYLVFDSKSGRE